MLILNNCQWHCDEDYAGIIQYIRKSLQNNTNVMTSVTTLSFDL